MGISVRLKNVHSGKGNPGCDGAITSLGSKETIAKVLALRNYQSTATIKRSRAAL